MSIAMAFEPSEAAELRAPSPVSELDRATLERCQLGDAMALRAFVVRYERLVFAVLSRMLGAGPHVEDLAQEAFLRALRALAGFDLDGPARVSTWLTTIAIRLALDAKKRRMVETEPMDRAEHVPSASTPEDERTRRELGRAIERAAWQLSDEQRAVWVLADAQGLTMAEIAGALALPENTVKTRLFRARATLREELELVRRET